MTANINLQNKPVIPEQVKSEIKAVAYPSSKVDTETKNIHSIEKAKAEHETESTKINQTEKTTEDEESSKQTLNIAVNKLNSYVQSINRNLEFNVDSDNGKTIVRVIDAETEELIRQIPDEEALNMTKQLAEKLMSESGHPGLLLTKLQA